LFAVTATSPSVISSAAKAELAITKRAAAAFEREREFFQNLPPKLKNYNGIIAHKIIIVNTVIIFFMIKNNTKWLVMPIITLFLLYKVVFI
jgi:hypothetical protein